MIYFLDLLHMYISCELQIEPVTISAIRNYSIIELLLKHCSVIVRVVV